MNEEYDQSVPISAIICRDIRSKQPKIVVRSAFADQEHIERCYARVQMLGGKKALLESKERFLKNFHLAFESHYQMVAKYSIELVGHFSDGSVRYWNGEGASKKMSSSATLSSRRQLGVPQGHLSDGTQLQIDITKLGQEIFPYLEK